MTNSNKIVSLWIDGPLRLIDQVCLTSMVANQLDVTLYTYGAVNNVPDGVKIANGEDVMSFELTTRLIPLTTSNMSFSVHQFSDFFRIECQRLGLGMWLDTDVLLFRKYTYNPEKMHFAMENRFRIGYSAIYLPMTNPICEDYYRLRSGANLTPQWLGFKRRVIKPIMFNILGKRFSSSDLGNTIYGNDGFTRIVKQYGFLKHSKQKKWLYHWAAQQNFRVFKNYRFMEMIEDEACLGLHIHKKGLATPNAVPGSLWEWALNKYRP